MRICFVGICLVMVLIQLSACKTPVMATGTGDPAGSGSPQPVAQSTSVSGADSITGSAATRPPSILSVVLSAHARGSDMLLEIASVSLKEGHFKRNFSNPEPRYLKAYFTDDAGTRLDSNAFEHPLSRRMEYPEENGKMATKMVATAEGAAYLRANYQPGITTLVIYSADNKKITSFHLNEYLKQ